ncbi:heterokaryon incompatibility protein-domain-containing protein [Massariosphaeria phaeospora]|uniref:Heterokaryon incompatibility protein-domain-containing protein n=1 Tax=Massariosphaeria phaeospora TaxID=100035 RepID=A0A7C8IAC5_9PLEO|nr:heterokaryon incompatibility protein-domain-containing protein [Massariosphaeria phaeospora]
MQHKDTKCSRGDVKLPLRVVDVEYDAAPSRIRLYEPNGMSGKYTALSYVWGKQNHYTTTKSSIDNHRQGIALDELPKTLQDAVTLTRKLGVQYLWVDALCIRQDDGPEWERESSKMADIYSNAYLTIAATGSEQATTGLFTQRTLPDYVKFKYTMDGVQGDIHAFLLQDALMPFSKGLLSDEPLSKRGWALQERFLASRNLHFATDQLFYECSGHCVSEDGFKSQGHFYAVRDPKALEEQYRGPSLWYHMLSFYYPRELTKSSDKLPALSGIVRLIEGQTADKYVAGLWRSQLIEGLTWQAMGTMSGKTSAPPEYRAPSWSWASMDGPFGYLGLGKDPIDTFEKWRDVATVIGCHIDLKGENSYGEITAGWLKIKAPLEPLLPSTEPEPDWETVPHKRALRMTTRNGNAFGAYMMFDTLDQDTASELPLSALVLVQAKGKTGSTYQALIVTPVDGPHGDYRRVGKVILVDDTLGKCGWMDDDTQLETITLV